MILVSFVLLILGGQAAEAQRVRVDVGGGWAFPTNNVGLNQSGKFNADVDLFRGGMEEDVEVSFLQQSVDLKSGRHVYAGIGFVRSIGDKFALGFRLRGHLSELESTVDCLFESTCKNPSGTLRAATVEGRIILTSPDWIDPYLLVGIGVVHTSVDGVTLRGVNDGSERTEGGEIFPDIPDDQENSIAFSEVSIVDAGGDVGIGASIPLTGGLALDGEFRVTGSLPGGKGNTVTTIPLTLGLAYTF